MCEILPQGVGSPSEGTAWPEATEEFDHHLFGFVGSGIPSLDKIEDLHWKSRASPHPCQEKADDMLNFAWMG